MSEAAKIDEGPSHADLLKSLMTYGSSKHVLNFTLEGGRKIKARAYMVRDTGERDSASSSQVYHVSLAYHSEHGNGNGHARATFLIDAESWGRWSFERDA